MFHCIIITHAALQCHSFSFMLPDHSCKLYHPPPILKSITSGHAIVTCIPNCTPAAIYHCCPAVIHDAIWVARLITIGSLGSFTWSHPQGSQCPSALNNLLRLITIPIEKRSLQLYIHTDYLLFRQRGLPGGGQLADFYFTNQIHK